MGLLYIEGDNVKKLFRPIIGFFFILLLICVYYINTPQYIVSSYWQYLSKGKYIQAEKLTSKEIFNLDLLNHTSLEEVFFKRTTLNHKQTQINNNKAIVSGIMSLPDIVKALDSNKDLADALQEVPIIQKEYTFELQRTNEGWRITSLNFGGD